MQQFKVGDKVRCIKPIGGWKGELGGGDGWKEGLIFTIFSITSGFMNFSENKVAWGIGTMRECGVFFEGLEKIDFSFKKQKFGIVVNELDTGYFPTRPDAVKYGMEQLKNGASIFLFEIGKITEIKQSIS